MKEWTSSKLNIKGSFDFPVAGYFRLGTEIGYLEFENKIPLEYSDGSLLKIGEKITGLTVMSTFQIPLPLSGQIKHGPGFLGSSFGFFGNDPLIKSMES